MAAHNQPKFLGRRNKTYEQYLCCYSYAQMSQGKPYLTIMAKIVHATTNKIAVAITARVIITWNMVPPRHTRSKRSVWMFSGTMPNAGKVCSIASINGGGPQMKY